MITKADIQLVRSLSDKKTRAAEGLFAIEGRKMVEEALASGLRVRRVFGTEEFSGVPGCETAPRKEIERMSSLKTPQGIVALVEIPVSQLPECAPGSLTLALDTVQDPGNLGTIIRTADWFGISDVVCTPASADCFNPKVVQATMGAILRVRVHYTDLSEFLGGVRGSGSPVYGTFLDGENIYEAGLSVSAGAVVVMGNESGGISPALAAHTSHRLFIPPWPAGNRSSESLNVATAAAIVCSEFRRRG